MAEEKIARTVGELIKLLQEHDSKMPLISCTADCGGYDVITTEAVEVWPSGDGRVYVMGQDADCSCSDHPKPKAEKI